MMNRADVASKIRIALDKLPGREFAEAATNLLGVLGYSSALLPDGQTGLVDDFIHQYPAITPGTQTERFFNESAVSIRVLFQFTDQEIAEQGSLFNVASFDTGNARSFLFAAVELKDASYPRGHYSTFAREINKRWQFPTVVLFRTSADLLTLAFVHRRPNRRDPDRDVLGSVSLIREIKPSAPHRAHLDILTELSLAERLSWMNLRRQSRNFDGLLSAWLDALDTEELNRRFYRELLRWFDRAVQPEFTRFPITENKVISAQEHVIRLITRMLFIWFIKEKGLVAPELFTENQVAPLLKGYDRATGDSYYRAVLQNLFFATLNTEINRRGFSSVSNPTHRDFTRYRFRSEMTDPNALVANFKRTPFINGGLFDCLDSEEAKGKGGYRIDCFSDRDKGLLSIPNRLFFGPDGLIDLFERYKFTVEENTPVEVEVALDPELLGKVFENLLAAYNPETRETARKQTGSYYTPRDVVDYMVDEALVACLSQKSQPSDGDRKWWEDRLHYLLDYNDAGEFFDPAETEQIVRAIADLRVLDPALGSGAFPMAVLHKLTLALRRLDPDNGKWEALQIELAGIRAAQSFHTPDRVSREAELKEISDTFERYRDSDFGRKLYLIQNSIYGVDIQPVATQIAKLRFFISLAIEQVPTGDPGDNYGIQPLPNLETRFVAADTLLGLEKPDDQLMLKTPKVERLERDLRSNRERHFHATTRELKMEFRNKDGELRRQLATALEQAEFSVADAARVAHWNPYDQNASAGWFHPKYMFNVEGGFDIVMGNPPYVQLQKDGGRLRKRYRDAGYATFTSTGDVYQLFYEQGSRLLSQSGHLAFITSNSWLKAEYGKTTRKHLAENFRELRLLEMGKDVFDNVIVDTSVLLGRRGNSDGTGKAVDMDRLTNKTFPPNEELWNDFRPRGENPWSVLSSIEQGIMDKMVAVGTPLKDWDIAIYRGITTGLNEAFIIDNETKETLVAEEPRSEDILKPVLRGRDIERYRANWAGMWLIDTHNGYDGVPAINVEDYSAVKTYLDGYFEQLEKRYDKGRTPYNLRNCAYHEDFIKEKLFWIDLTERGRFAYDDSVMFCVNSAYMMTGDSIKYLCAVLNSTLVTWFMRSNALNSGMGTTRWVRFTVDRIPVPAIDITRQRPFIQLVDRALYAHNAKTNKLDLESQIDRLVYALYGLTEDEVQWIASR